MSNTTGDNAMSNFVTIRLAQDERVTDCGGLVFVEMENSAGESINLYPQHVSEDGAICIDIPQDASVSEIQRLQAQIAELQSAKASAVSVPMAVYTQLYSALKEDEFNPIFTKWAVDQFLSAGDPISNQTRAGAGE